MTIRVLLADDHPLTRAGLSAYLQKETGIELVGEAEDGIAAWELVSKLRPDVALLDIRMPGADGVTVARQIKEAVPLFKQKGTLPGLTAAFEVTN